MGFWEKAKKSVEESVESARQARDEAMYTQEYDEKDAKRAAEGMEHDVEPTRLLTKMFSKAPLDHLDDDEESLHYFLKGFDLDVDDNDEGHESHLLVTNKKVVMLAWSITTKTSQYVVSFQDIIGISVQRRMRSHIRIQTAGHSYKISVARSSPVLAEDVVEFIRKQKDQINTENQDTVEESALEKLERLADLRDNGAVSDKEFNEKKQELMEDI
ncbi:MAG: SHOCT domain-containing protein [Halobacteriales archaeon]|nr:SHOCT domain-containing protein [Halobacteriales archaeon]